jgi:hypothetical protein
MNLQCHYQPPMVHNRIVGNFPRKVELKARKQVLYQLEPEAYLGQVIRRIRTTTQELCSPT